MFLSRCRETVLDKKENNHENLPKQPVITLTVWYMYTVGSMFTKNTPDDLR